VSTYETLIFIPEGSLLNEKVAERNALRQTLKHFQHEFGPAERLKYTSLQKQVKLLPQNKRIDLLLQTFLKQDLSETKAVFEHKMRGQDQLIKGSPEFLDQVKGKLNLILLAKESKEQILPRLAKSELINYFSVQYFKGDFSKPLPNKDIFFKILDDNPTIDPDTTLVIGTNLDEEIQGAENANLDSLWLAPKKEKLPINPHPTLHLSKLSDLLFYLNLN